MCMALLESGEWGDTKVRGFKEFIFKYAGEVMYFLKFCTPRKHTFPFEKN